MASEGIEGYVVETRNYGATAAFWRSLGYSAAFETDHGSGSWVHPNGGPYVFIVETQEDRPMGAWPIVRVADSTAFAPERELDWEVDWTPQHWGVVEAVVRDPDGRVLSLQAPLPPGVEAPDMDAHHAETH